MDKNAAWDNLSYERQKRYLQNHPGSQRKLTKGPDGGKTSPEAPKSEAKPTNKAPDAPSAPKNVDWENVHNKVVDKMKSMEPTVTPFNPEEIGKKLTGFKPTNDVSFPMHDMRDEAHVNGDQVEIGIRDLGRWHTPEDVSDEDAEDYDWQEWSPGEAEKYTGKFQNWLKTQSWFDPTSMEPYVSSGEKNWAYFGIRPKQPKK